MSTALLTVTARVEAPVDATGAASLTLPFAQRCRSRLRAALDDGREVALFLPRGGTLRGGDLLRADDGTLVRMVAAPERVSTAAAGSLFQLQRACYHLGNRHIALQVGGTWLRYVHDHVLDEMVRAIGLEVTVGDAPFEPESGAYGGHGHGHGHSHSHGSGHEHGHGGLAHAHGL